MDFNKYSKYINSGMSLTQNNIEILAFEGHFELLWFIVFPPLSSSPPPIPSCLLASNFLIAKSNGQS